jgi:hypothetical protein
MNHKQRIVCWLCLTALTVSGLKYVPTYLLEQRKLDQQDRVLDFQEHGYLRGNTGPTVSVPAPATFPRRSQLL